MNVGIRKLSRMTVLFLSTSWLLGAAASACGSNEELPCCDAESLDPYCVETPNWYEEVDVSAEFDTEEPSLLVVSFEPTNEIVDMNGYVQVDGADVESLVFADHELWLVLKTYPSDDTITLHGAVDCTTLTQGFYLILSISPEGDVTYEISYTMIDDADAGDADGGDTETSK